MELKVVHGWKRNFIVLVFMANRKACCLHEMNESVKRKSATLHTFTMETTEQISVGLD
jgi:hypothetical protein